MLSINTNLSSYIAQNSLKTSTNKLNQAIERMTTGFKINHASDNVANYSITTNMSSKLSSYEVAEENTQMGLDLLVTASDTLSLIEDRVQRLRDLQEQALNGTYGEDSLKAINQECNSLVDEINRLYLGCEYNGINLFLEKTTSADGTAEILQTDYADKNTRFEQLGITSSSFSIYDKNDTLLTTYDIEGTDSIDDFLSALKTEGFNADITGGKISVTSKTGLYIAGDLADKLGITQEQAQDIISTTQTSNLPVEYDTVTTSTKEETVYKTTTTETTQTITVYTTTTTESTQTETVNVTTTSETTTTETIKVETTAGVAKSSDSKVTYSSIMVRKRYDAVVDMDGNYGRTIVGFATKDVNYATIDVTPTYCATLADVVALASNYLDYVVIAYSPNDLHFRFYDEDGCLVLCVYDDSLLGHQSSSYVPEECETTIGTTTTTTTSTQTATSSQNLSTLGITATQYITVKKGETETVLTCKTTDTIGSVVAKLTSAGITASFASGKLSISATDNAYISGMSDSLKSALKLSGDFTTVKTVETENTTTTYVTTTADVTQTTTIYTTTTTSTTETQTLSTTTTTSATETRTINTTTTHDATGATTLKDMGLSGSMNVTINSNGTKSIVSIDENTSIDELVAKLNTGNLNVSFTDSKLTISGTGDTYVTSSKLASLFNLSPINNTTGNKTVNSDSNKLTYERNLLDEVGDIYAPGSLNLQIGINTDSNSQITVKTSFSLTGYSAFRNIGLDGNNYLDQIDDMMKVLNNRQVEFGAIENRLESVLDEISTHYENLSSSRSTLRDADIAEVSSEYIRQQILQQASATLLSTANQTPSIALQLI